MYILGSVFTIICAVVLPITLAVIFCVRKKEIWKPILFGALTFSFFQVLIRAPLLLAVLPYQAWYMLLQSTQPVLYALFLGGTAAFFEEGGRYIVMSIFLKKQRSTSDGIAFGVGHGGIEAILFVGINAIVTLVFSSFITTSSEMFAGGIERFSTLVIQIGFSVMVMNAVREKNYLWLLLAFVIHTVIDFGTELLKSSMSLWVMEAIIFAAALLMTWFIYEEYKREIKSF